MKPIRMQLEIKVLGAILMWLLGRRRWQVSKDFHYELNGVKYVIPKGFSFDGASVPKFLQLLSPVGVLLLGGLIHDYAYKYAASKPALQQSSLLVVDQKQQIKFSEISI